MEKLKEKKIPSSSSISKVNPSWTTKQWLTIVDAIFNDPPKLFVGRYITKICQDMKKIR